MTSSIALKTSFCLCFFFVLAGSSRAFAAGEKTKPAGGFLPLAPHGGIVRENNKMNLELVSQGEDVYLYPLAKMGEPLPATEIEVVVTVTPQSDEEVQKSTSETPESAGTGHVKAAKPAPKKSQLLAVQLDSDHYKVHIPFSGPYELVVHAKKKSLKSAANAIVFKFNVKP